VEPILYVENAKTRNQWNYIQLWLTSMMKSKRRRQEARPLALKTWRELATGACTQR